ncbi:hypothetical protein ACIRFH_32150 [Streptomyces sp. NPDC093586]|uniref:hypothetical protein n=1 Tax=Streptomyces sp. NPDC093586 TaxID=3366042 RepID=UPI00381A79A2
MSATTHAETKVSLALDAIQSKRRIERVNEAATALLERYSTHTGTEDRVNAFFELVRRNFTPEIAVEFRGLVLCTDAVSAERGDHVFRATLKGADGAAGTVTAYYAPPGTLGLTADEWQAAMRLLTGILGLALGGSATI